MSDARSYNRQWRDYRTTSGARPVHKFLMSLTSDERAEITAAMREVSRDGLVAAKHLTGDIYEVKADTTDKFFRVLFAAEGQYGQVLLSLEAFRQEEQQDAEGQARPGRETAEELAHELRQDGPGDGEEVPRTLKRHVLMTRPAALRPLVDRRRPAALDKARRISKVRYSIGRYQACSLALVPLGDD